MNRRYFINCLYLIYREPVVAIRTRAMKCLGNIVEVDQSILVRKDMQMGVQQKLLDTAISVREAAVDLVGKYILTDRSLVDQYYDMIAPRILVSLTKLELESLMNLIFTHFRILVSPFESESSRFYETFVRSFLNIIEFLIFA